MNRKLFILVLLTAVTKAWAWDGSGTSADPYQIRNSADWVTLADEVANDHVAEGTAFLLMGDINATTMVGTSSHHFMGSFDGGGHTITVDISTESGRAAPFGFIESASISHLKIAGSIRGGLHSAGLTGSVTGIDNRITDCHVSARITVFAESGMIVVGGFAGHGRNVTVEGCLFDGELIAESSIEFSYGGAIMGWSTLSGNIMVKNCLENGSYTSITHAGMNYAEDHSASTVPTTNCYSIAHNWSEVKHGYPVIYLSDTFQPTYEPTDIYTTSGIEASAVGLKLGDIFYAGSGQVVTVCPPRVNGEQVDGFVGYDFSTNADNRDNPYISFGDYILTMPAKDVYVSQYKDFDGDGDANRPYLIKNEDDWQHFAMNMSDYNIRDKHFRLTNDIDIHVRAGYEYTHSGDLIKGYFMGTFDGDGHTITAHLSGGDVTSVFYKIDGATIKNLHVAGEISGGLHASGLVGSVSTDSGNGSVIENCRVSATINCSSTHAGGFIGHASSASVTLRGCLFDGTISGNSLANAGYLVGWCSNNGNGITLQDCAAYNHEVTGASGLKSDLVLDDTGTARCGSVSNTYGGYNIGKSRVTLRNGNPTVDLSYYHQNELVDYPVSHLTSYGQGLMFDDVFLVGHDEQPRFKSIPDPSLAVSVVSVSVDGLTVTQQDGWYALSFSNNPNSLFTINTLLTSTEDYDGYGTEDSPYLIQNTAEWVKLSLDVAGGNTFEGEVFRMAQDIDACSTIVGTDSIPFKGIFDGDGHTLTINIGTEYTPAAKAMSPFYRAEEATFRHLRTAGKICTSAHYTGGIISQVFGTGATRLYDCHSSVTVFSTIDGDASNGGLVGAASNCDSLVIERSTFTGNLHGRFHATTNCGGLVGWSNVPVTIRQSLFDPNDLSLGKMVSVGQNFARMSNYSQLKLEECYTTFNFKIESFFLIALGFQGTFVVDELFEPQGGSYEFIGEPDVTFNGRAYYKNGCWIRTTLADNIPFDHWQDGVNGGCFISDPWSRNGLHQLKDMDHKPSLGVWTSAIPEPETERTLWGVKYRYLSRRDYHFYISDEDRRAKGWVFESDDNDANLIVKDSNNKASEITAITGYKESDYNDDGVQIHNDLVGDWRNHTHLGLIAPHAFRGSTKLETLYFKDTDANNYNQLLPFSFFIDQGAFENCPNFTELKMMQYTTRGDNHWEALTPEQVTKVADDAFNGCPKLKISAQNDQYQNFLSSAIWKQHRERFIIYEATTEDFTVNGVKYHWYRSNDQTSDLKNDESGKQQMMTQIRPWNGDFQQFNAASLLDTKDDCNVYYASVVGVNDDDIDGENGVMIIYNDPGSYYNYKTIVLNRDAIKGNTHVKYIEFWQTNGRSANSYSDLKMVIPNGAFQGCTNLKELRLFYYVEDGDNRWMSLGPKDVIPGDNIFGNPSLEQLCSADSLYYVNEMSKNPTNFKILVSTELYPEFQNDPNWQPYLTYLEPVDYSPSTRGEFANGGLTYDYMTSPGGIMQASQVVSQDVSWWTAPRIAIEVALAAYTIGTWASAQGSTATLSASAGSAKKAFESCGEQVAGQQLVVQAIDAQANALASAKGSQAVLEAILNFNMSEVGEKSLQGVVSNTVISELTKTGIVSATGKVNSFMMNGYMINRLAASLSQTQVTMLQTAFFQLARHELFLATTQLTALQASLKAAEQAWRSILVKEAFAKSLDWTVKISSKSLLYVANPISTTTTTAGLIASQCWGGSGSYNAQAMNKGMRENILANIHQVGLVGGGYVITTPQKNLVFHTYIKNVDNSVQDAVIYAGFDNDNNTNTSNRTMTFLPNVFKNKTNLRTVKFHDISNQSSNTGMPFLFTIPDSAFNGCTALTEFSTLLQTDGNGTRALGPENFILAGDSIFVGRKCKAEVDSLTAIGQGAGLVPFYIVIDPLRKDDFLASESWKPLERFFKYESAQPTAKYSEYGAQYAYAYEQNSIKKEHKVTGHLIEHTLVTGPDNDFINGHQGAVKLCNDIGVYNNYQLDEVMAEAFKNNKSLRSVSFVDLYGFGAIGDCYTDLKVHIGDRAFQGCSNMANLDLLYMVTDGSNHIEPMTPQMITIGKDVFKDSPARIKMMPQQVAWFEADSSWVAYKDRFTPCVIRFTDPGIKKSLKDMAYYDPANTGTDPAMWDDYCDFARIAGAGFSWLDDRFDAQRDNIYSFSDFKYFESVGLDYVGDWFRECTKLANIELPSTIKRIGEYAFMHCTSLKEIVIPAAVTLIDKCAFDLCLSLNTIVVKGDVPATLGESVFDKHEGLKIYVPADKVNAYKTAWSEYAQYIVGDDTYHINKVVTVEAPGQLASKLGLTLNKENSKVRYIQGPYARYDSLTVIGPLNGEDVAVLRHMMGANAWESEFTDGQLRYLNLWDAQLKADNSNSYNGYGVDEYLEKDNWVGEYMFHNCNALESVVLPKTVTEIGENTFQEAFGLKRIAVGRNTTTLTRDLLQDLTGIEELVFLTNSPATSESSDPWEAPIQQVYTLPSQIGDYLGDPNLTQQAQDITSPFSSDDVMWALADKGHFFPSQYLQLENVEGIFNGNTTIKDLDEFFLFRNVKHLENTFSGMSQLTTVTLPSGIESISASAFSGCTKLKTIHVSSIQIDDAPTDSVASADPNAPTDPGDQADPNASSDPNTSADRYITPTLAQDAFASLPQDFQILVPREYCKLYRERWAQYADHINPDKTNYAIDDIITVTVTEPNTLAQKLGLTATTQWATGFGANYVISVKGDYSKVRRLKVVGPISGGDLDVLCYLSGYCPWTSTRNYAGRLEYIDLYDAQLRASDVGTVGYQRNGSSFFMSENFQLNHVSDNILPMHAFLRAYNLRTLILPRTCTEVSSRALQECEGLEALVLGDDMRTFNWNALDDDAMLTRMYILATQKVNISTELTLWRWLCNNYNPTFDAFYVRPSLYQQYLNDDAYTGSSWQRTNNVSKGDFEDDESFAVFASHAAASFDDLTQVYNVDGWFDNHSAVRDLTALGFAAIDTLRAEDMQKLTQLEKVTLPVTLSKIEDGAFSQSPNLRYVDMLMCDDIMVDSIKGRGITRLGIDSLQTLVYLPQTYGEANGTNIVVFNGSDFTSKKFRLVDSKNYCVPYPFSTADVENTRALSNMGSLYTVFLPYELNVPAGAKAYVLADRNGDELVFQEVTGRLAAMQPYLVRPSSANATLNTTVQQTIPASGGGTMSHDKSAPGYTMRGTFEKISNAEAHSIGAYLMQSDNRWYPAPANIEVAYIPPFRCYLLQNGGNARVLGMQFEDATTTTVETLRTIDADGTETIYDLSGRRINKGAKGLVIKDGKIIFNK